ncbi:hypothetical protein SELMODRAFT_109461 [Selaginella moellendorffii]|uniref:Uncharacterized protein n=1 Tax=Selaginella moellendorffii TaxID=88036 RepID=D8S5Z8_SELML|nr:hypothetical protein SELMODRAFT_109461 [Selaginella moellendorffii]
MGFLRNQCYQLQKRVAFPARSWTRRLATVAYMENSSSNPVAKLVSSLPIVGLFMRILSDEGGIGGDRVDFPDFYTRVQKRCPEDASGAFARFVERHGKVAKPMFVLVWCWVAAVGAGLLKSEDIAMAASRLRVSYDVQYEVDCFGLLMDEALQKRRKSNSPVPDVPMITRIDKALDGICACSIGTKKISKEDAELLSKMMSAVFPGVPAREIDELVETRVSSAS